LARGKEQAKIAYPGSGEREPRSSFAGENGVDVTKMKFLRVDADNKKLFFSRIGSATTWFYCT
jgi:hypothetical protein